MRLIDADHIVKVAEHAYREWCLAMAAADGTREINKVFKMQELCKAVCAVAESAPTINFERMWVPVSERVPTVYKHKDETQIPFLVCTKNAKYPSIAFFNGKTWKHWGVLNVVAWMPLPEPYKTAGLEDPE